MQGMTPSEYSHTTYILTNKYCPQVKDRESAKRRQMSIYARNVFFIIVFVRNFSLRGTLPSASRML